jgi:hypothetical protein
MHNPAYLENCSGHTVSIEFRRVVLQWNWERMNCKMKSEEKKEEEE